MLKFSSGLLLAIMGTIGFAGAMQGGVVRIFSGPRPDSADDAIPGGATEIARITTEGRVFYPGADTEGAGLQFSLGAGGVLRNGGVWMLRGIATGTPSWFRMNWSGADANESSAYLPRVDGDVGMTEFYDLVLPLESISPGQTQRLGEFIARIPN